MEAQSEVWLCVRHRRKSAYFGRNISLRC